MQKHNFQNLKVLDDATEKKAALMLQFLSTVDKIDKRMQLTEDTF